MTTKYFSVLVIGAGQAGLAAAHELLRRGVEDFALLDANPGPGPGGAWRHRWDSLTLGAAHGIADLPGLAMDRPDPSVPASKLVTEYYGAYEDHFDLPVIRPARVKEVTGDGPFTVTLDSGTQYSAEVIINATGTWDSPYIPGIERFRGRQLHTANYSRKEDFAGLKTLVVGGGLWACSFSSSWRMSRRQCGPPGARRSTYRVSTTPIGA